MVRSCCVNGCSTSKEDVVYYKFPKSRVLKRKWLEAVNLKKVTISSLICSEHFTDGDQEMVRGKKKLRSRAVPSVFADITKSKSPESTKEACDNDSIANSTVNNGEINDTAGKDAVVETGEELQENGGSTEENVVLDLSNKESRRDVSVSPKQQWDDDTISNSPDITKDDIEDILTNYHIKQNKALPSESGKKIQSAEEVGVKETEENRADQVEREELPPDKSPGDEECIDVDQIQDKSSQPVFIEISVDQDPNGPNAGAGSPRDCLMLLESVQVDVDPATLMLPERESDVEVLEKKDDPISLLTSSDEDDVIIQEPHIDTVEVSDETDEDDMPLVKLVKTKKTKNPKDTLSKIMWGAYEYYCVKCNHTTFSKSEHRVHLAGHSTAVQICTLCSYTTASKAQFARHKRKHMEERKHKCHLCDYKARHGMSLIYHLKSHDQPNLSKLCSAKVKKFSCDKCCYETKRRSDLKRHKLRRHKDFVEDDDEYVPPSWV